jgi:hypothetical protein
MEGGSRKADEARTPFYPKLFRLMAMAKIGGNV